MQQNAGIRAEVRKAEKAAKLAEQQRREVIVALCSNAPGRTYLWQQLEDACIFQTVYDDIPQRMAFNEGRRTAGLRLLTDIMQAAPEQFIQIMVEANGRRDTSTEPARGAGNGRDDQGSGDDADDSPRYDDREDGFVSENGQRVYPI